MPLFTAKLKRQVVSFETTTVQFEATSIMHAMTRALEVAESTEIVWEEDDVSESTSLAPVVVDMDTLAEGNEKLENDE